MKNECPCRFCSDRDELCHSTCERYKEYKRINDTERDRRFEQKEKNDILFNPKAVSRQWQR